MSDDNPTPQTLRDVRRAYAESRNQDYPPQNLLADAGYLERRNARLKEDEMLARKQASIRTKEHLELWRQNIAPRWRDAGIQDSVMPEHIKENIKLHVSRWAVPKDERKHLSFLFAGSYGRGKTWTAYAYMHELIKAGQATPQQICLLSEARLAEIVKSGYQRPAKMAELLDPKHQIFFVDEIGRGEFKSGVERGIIWFELMDHIYSNQLCLIMTTNLETGETEDHFGSASTDRLRALVGSDGYVPFRSEKNMRQELGQYNSNKS